jgi:hypothetical protein
MTVRSDKAQFLEQAPFFHPWDRVSVSRSGHKMFTWKELVNALSSELPPGAAVSSHRECGQGGLRWAPYRRFHRSCTSWSDKSHRVAAKGALRKPSTRSGWLRNLPYSIALSCKQYLTKSLANSNVLNGGHFRPGRMVWQTPTDVSETPRSNDKSMRE